MSKVLYDKIVKMVPQDLDNFIILIGMNEKEAEFPENKTETYKITIEKV